MAVTDVSTEPRIYVASLSDYNAGILHGVHINLFEIDDMDELWVKVNAMLKASPTTRKYGDVAEEWAIHDYEGFGDWNVGEWESFETLLKVAKCIEEKGDAFTALVSNDDSFLEGRDAAECMDWFDGCFCGEWNDEKEYTYNYVEEVGLPGGTSLKQNEDLEPYLDWDALTEWATQDMTIITNPSYNVWVFRSEP